MPSSRHAADSMTDFSSKPPAEAAPADSPAAVPDNAAAAAANTDSADKAADDLLIIFGETCEGKKFRPSDWCDRLYGTLRVLGDEAEEVAEYVHLVTYGGQRCIMIDGQLKDVHSGVYSFYTRFASDNNLRTNAISRQNWDSERG